jgi:hypothetical protein
MLEIKINKVQWDNFMGKFVVVFGARRKGYETKLSRYEMLFEAVDEVDAFKKFKQEQERRMGANNVIWL